MMSVFVSPVIAAITVGKEQNNNMATLHTAHSEGGLKCKSVRGQITTIC